MGEALRFAVFLFQVIIIELLYLIKRDHLVLTAVVKVGMDGIGYDEKLLIICILAVLCHCGVGVLAEITGVGFFAVNDENGTSDLAAVCVDRLVHEGHTADDIPAAI